MSKRPFVSLAALLAAANLTFAADPVMPSEALPPPAAIATEAPAGFFSEMSSGCSRRALTADAEIMLWFLKSSIGSFPVSTIDNFGQTVGLSGGNLDDKNGPIAGGRFTLGYWQIQDSPWATGGIKESGVESRLFFVGRRSVDVVTDTPPTLVRPFFDLNNRTTGAALVGAPGLATGFISAHGHTDIWGVEANAWKNVFFNYPGTSYAIRVMGGIRYLNATSAINIAATSVYAPTIAADSIFAPFAGNRLQVFDSFTAHNHFLGPQVGIALDSWFIDCFCFETSFRLAVGNTNEQLKVAGNQVRTFADGSTAASQGGLLALPSNIGDREINKFTLVPEFNLKIRAPIGSHLTLSTGFSAMYWNRILRASEQIDRTIDITQIPNFPAAAGSTPTGLGRPGTFFKQSDLWLLGASAGVEVTW